MHSCLRNTFTTHMLSSFLPTKKRLSLVSSQQIHMLRQYVPSQRCVSLSPRQNLNFYPAVHPPVTDTRVIGDEICLCDNLAGGGGCYLTFSHVATRLRRPPVLKLTVVVPYRPDICRVTLLRYSLIQQ